MDYLKTNFERMMKNFPFIEKVTGTGLLIRNSFR